MKLLNELQKQIGMLDDLRRAWFTSFNTDIEFVERHVLPATLGGNTPRNRLEYEQLQQELTTRRIDFRVFCDPRFLETHRIKRTCIPVHGIRPQRTGNGGQHTFSESSLFHPKVIYLEDRKGRRVVGAGSANLTVSGWGSNLEAFQFFEVKSYRNYKEIRSFFEQICGAADIKCDLDERPRFSPGKESWQFAHSYQEKSFPEQLLSDTDDADLAVWSPYLPQDLDTFLHRLETAAGAKNLRVHLVADRSSGHVRTGWDQALEQLQRSRRLSFHKNPLHIDSRTELCHAKIWKVAEKLAIGSWNFTGPGSNSLRKGKDDTDWHPDNNIEAGFLIEDEHAWQQACGDVLTVGREHCATEIELENEGLVVAKLPPFDLHVSFDWNAQTYHFDGQWIEGKPTDGFEIVLPGGLGPLALKWNGHRKPLTPSGITVDERVLLRDRVFRVFCGPELLLSGIVSELQTSARRAQHFESLEDLFDALAVGDDAAEHDTLPFRIPLDTDTFPDEAPDPSHPGKQNTDKDAATRAPLSYFRLFHSTQSFRQKLQSLDKLERLDQHVFLWPGCLQEMVEKVHSELQKPGREVFHWFLVQEVNWLCESARAMRRKLVRGYKQNEQDYKPVPESRWRDLHVPSVKAPAVAPGYLEQVNKQWIQHG